MKMRGRKIQNWDWPSIQAGTAVTLSAFLFLTENLSPFAPALLSAALCAGLNGGILLAFAVLGAVLSGQYWLIAGAAACFLIHKLLKKPTPEVCAAIAAMLGALLCGALTTGLRLTAVLSAILACALAPSLACGFQIHPGRRVLAPEEKLSLSLIWLLALAGLARCHPLGLIVARCLSALCAMAAARLHTAAGVSAGLLTGAACLCGAKFPVLLGAGAAAAGASAGAWEAPQPMGR